MERGSRSTSAAFASCLDDECVLAFMEGRLSAEAAGRVKEHIRLCEECRGLVADTAKACFETSQATKPGHGAEELTLYDKPVPTDRPILAAGTQLGRYRIQ